MLAFPKSKGGKKPACHSFKKANLCLSQGHKDVLSWTSFSLEVLQLWLLIEATVCCHEPLCPWRTGRWPASVLGFPGNPPHGRNEGFSPPSWRCGTLPGTMCYSPALCSFPNTVWQRLQTFWLACSVFKKTRPKKKKNSYQHWKIRRISSCLWPGSFPGRSEILPPSPTFPSTLRDLGTSGPLGVRPHLPLELSSKPEAWASCTRPLFPAELHLPLCHSLCHSGSRLPLQSPHA